jgi:hypothetical protein
MVVHGGWPVQNRPVKLTEIEPLYISIAAAAKLSDESVWSVKVRLREGVYRARKSGRRTLVEVASVKDYLANLPVAKFRPMKRRKAA